MPSSIRIALTADLHWGVRPAGDAAARRLVEFLLQNPPDLLILAGDIGTQDHFGDCLELFSPLACRKGLLPGNHDIWVEANDSRGDSLALYEQVLPEVSRQHGFHYFDQSPMFFPDADLAIVGSINWYDYSWSIDRLKEATSDWEARLKGKTFSRGRHNDYNFVRWQTNDAEFTQRVVAQFQTHMQQALAEVSQAIAVTHHPCFHGLNYPSIGPATVDRLLWEAFSGNRAMEEMLLKNQERIPFAFCGHTHKARENQLGSILGFNIGGDYDWKRLILLEWPAGTIQSHEFQAG